MILRLFMRVEWLSCYFSGVGECVSLFWGGLSIPRKQGIYTPLDTTISLMLRGQVATTVVLDLLYLLREKEELQLSCTAIATTSMLSST
jgi:hypothetical protein